jgi:membrane protein YqaA with SNARE-associated domain
LTLKKILHFFDKYKVWLLAILKPLGFWGAGAIAFVDAAAFPVPMDLILAGYVWANRQHFYLYVVVAAAGSALGGLVPYFIGRAGGELFLMKRIDRDRYENLRDRFEKQEFLAMMVPSILPPPTPWKLFVLAAGVFEMKVGTFLLAVFTGRVIRDMVTAILTIKYGPQIVTITERLATQHRVALVTGVVLVLVLLLYWLWRTVWKRRGKKDSPGLDTELAKVPK